MVIRMIFDRNYRLKKLELVPGSININKSTADRVDIHSDDSGKIMVHFVNRDLDKDAIDYVKQHLIDNRSYNGKKEDLKLEPLRDFDLYSSSNNAFRKRKGIESLIKEAINASRNTGRPIIAEPVPEENSNAYDVVISNGYFREFMDDKIVDNKNTPKFFKHFNLGSSQYYTVLVDPKTRSLVVSVVRREGNNYNIHDNGLDDIVCIPKEIITPEKLSELIKLKKTE